MELMWGIVVAPTHSACRLDPCRQPDPMNSFCVALTIGIVDFRKALDGDFFIARNRVWSGAIIHYSNPLGN